LLLRSPCLTPLKPVALSDARTSVSPSLAAARSALRRAAQIHHTREEEAVKDLRRTQRPSAREYQLLLRAPSARSRRDLGGAGDAPMTRGGGRIVKVSKSGFDPPKLFVAPGEVVRWVMEDAATAHRLVCDAFTKSYEPKTQGQSITHAFESTGEYVVRCAICKARGTVNVGGREAPPSENVRQLRDEMSAAEAEGAAQLASLGAYDGGSSSSDDGDDDDEQERYAQARHERVWGRKSAAGASSPEDGATGGLRSASSSPDGERSAAAVPAAAWPQTPPAPPPALEAADSILPTTGNKISAILSARARPPAADEPSPPADASRRHVGGADETVAVTSSDDADADADGSAAAAAPASPVASLAAQCEVRVSAEGFEPAAVYVAPGAVVVWVVTATSSLGITLLCDEFEVLPLAPLRAGGRYEHRFEQTGTFTVSCKPPAKGECVVDVRAGRAAPPSCAAVATPESAELRRLRARMAAAQAEGDAARARLGAFAAPGDESAEDDFDGDDAAAAEAEACSSGGARVGTSAYFAARARGV
jgi:plastocyanin